MLEGHTAPIVALALSPDGTMLASASWDQTVRLWPVAGGAPRVLEGHSQNVNGVAFTPDGRALVSVSYDQSVRIWPLAGTSPPTVVAMPSPLNAVAVGGDGEIAVGAGDGRVYFLAADGARSGDVAAGPRPVISLAVSPDGALAAAASIGGSVGIIDRKTRALARTLVGPGLPVWSVAFLPDSHTLLTGGADNIIRRWNAATGEPVDSVLVETAGDPLAAYAGDRGAEIFRACVACHTLNGEQANRAGPTLAGIFGRRIATAPGYNFSEALKRLDIVWTPETVSKLFEVGPAAYTPGTKMPEQRIGSEAGPRRAGAVSRARDQEVKDIRSVVFEHDLRANAMRLSRGKPVSTSLTRPCGSGSCSRTKKSGAPMARLISCFRSALRGGRYQYLQTSAPQRL